MSQYLRGTPKAQKEADGNILKGDFMDREEEIGRWGFNLEGWKYSGIIYW